MQSSIQCQKDYMVERYLNNSLISRITFKNKCAYFLNKGCDCLAIRLRDSDRVMPNDSSFFFFFKNDPANQKSWPTVCGAHPYAKAQNSLYLKCAL